MPKLLTYSQAALFLNEHGVPIAEGTLRHMVSARRIPHLKFSKRVLFDPNALETWLADRVVKVTA